MSRIMLIAVLVRLMARGISGLSSARVARETDTSMADVNAWNAEMRIYVMDAFLTASGTKADASWGAAPTKTTDMTSPATV
jgi:hypothetical protein